MARRRKKQENPEDLMIRVRAMGTWFRGASHKDVEKEKLYAFMKTFHPDKTEKQIRNLID